MEEFFSCFLAKTQFKDFVEFVEIVSFDIYDWTLVFAAAFLFLEILNDLVTGREAGKRFRESLSSLFTQVPFYIAELLIFGTAVYGYFMLYEIIPWKMPDTPACFILVIFLADFIYYVEHYCLHKVRLLWAAHSVHHSSGVMNTAMAFRFSFFDPIVSATFHLPLVLLGFNPIFIFAAEILVQAYQFWIHNEMIGKLGPLEWLLNTPSHHRVHHGSDRKYLDRNYGGILIIWDRLFGTFAKEEETPTYGLHIPFTSVNPIKVQFFEFANLFRDLSKPRAKGHRLNYLLKPPGWHPPKPKVETGDVDHAKK